MTERARKRIFTLLNAIKADHRRLKTAIEQRFNELGIVGSYDLEVSPSTPIQELPTFDQRVRRAVTPMISARFEHSGQWRRGLEIWLGPEAIAIYMGRRAIRRMHRAMRENLVGSAPMLFPDRRLTLLETSKGVPEDLTYLVWPDDIGEPEVWRYSGYDVHTSANLAEYLKWLLERP